MNLRRGVVFENSILREKAQHYKNHQAKIYRARPAINTGLAVRMNSVSKLGGGSSQPSKIQGGRARSEHIKKRTVSPTVTRVPAGVKGILPGMARHGRELLSDKQQELSLRLKMLAYGKQPSPGDRGGQVGGHTSSVGEGTMTFLTAPVEDTKQKLESKSRSPANQSMDRRQFHQREVKKNADILVENKVEIQPDSDSLISDRSHPKTQR